MGKTRQDTNPFLVHFVPMRYVSDDVYACMGDRRVLRENNTKQNETQILTISSDFWLYPQVVWGLSILGHVPRNSLLESLAGFLTEKFRDESGHNALPPAESVTAAASTTASAVGGTVEGAAVTATQEMATGRDAAAGVDGAVPGVGAADDKVSREEAGSSAGASSSIGGGDGGVDGVQAVRALSGGDPGRRAVGSEVDGGQGGAAASAAVDVVVTSGTDLATAALSFAYAHAR